MLWCELMMKCGKKRRLCKGTAGQSGVVRFLILYESDRKDEIMLFIMLFLFVMICAIVPAWLIVEVPRISKVLEPQKEREQKESQLAQMKGLEKCYKMALDKEQQDKKCVATLRRYGELRQQLSTYQKKEKDWAIMGGIADGLAGPAAGVIMASNVMKSNAKIRAENADRMEMGKAQNRAFQALASLHEANSSRAPSMEELQEKYEIIRSRKPEELFSLIKFSDKKIDVDKDTGAVTVSVSWNQDDKSVCIDGALKAKLYTKSGKYAGCAYLVLPQNGTAGFKGKLSGICACPIGTDAYLYFWWRHYTVEIEPLDLWELALR